MSRLKGIFDTNTQPLYDTVAISTSSLPTVAFFQNPIGAAVGCFGAAGQAKTKADTNLQLPGQLPKGFAFTLLGFRLAFPWNVVTADLTTILNGCVFEFSVAQKSFLTVPARTIPGGNGPFGTGTSLNNNGYPTLGNVFGIQGDPLIIEDNMNFNVTLFWSGTAPTITQTGFIPATSMPITVYMDGKLTRPAQ